MRLIKYFQLCGWLRSDPCDLYYLHNLEYTEVDLKLSTEEDVLNLLRFIYLWAVMVYKLPRTLEIYVDSWSFQSFQLAIKCRKPKF